MLPELTSPWLIVIAAFGAIALLYSSVGHAGATGYLAIMAIAGIEPAVMRPTALVLNLVVGSIVTARFATARQIELRRLLPLVATSIPAAALGATIALPGALYRPLVAAILVVAAARACEPREESEQRTDCQRSG